MESPDQPQRRRGRLVRGLILAALASTVVAGCGRVTGGGATDSATPAAPVAFSKGDLKAALNALSDAPAQGFAPGAFGDVARLSAQVGSSDPGQQEAGGTAAREALIAYARAEHGLGLPRGQFPKEWDIRPAPYDAAADLDQAITQHRFTAWLAALAPQEPRYQGLVHALATYRQAAAQGGWAPIPDGPALRQGSRGARVAALRARLASEDPALKGAAPQGAPSNPAAAPAMDANDGLLAKAVADAQLRYGLKPTGVADAATLAALNVPMAARVNEIRANLERWRWLPRQLPATRVEVDAATGTMDYYVAGRPVLHMLAAAGKPDDETPMLISTITNVEFNPPWKVPADIVQKELLPKEAANPGYLERNDFVKGTTDAAPLVQKAGPKSALGQVKFEFDNPFGVYLHDTPSKAAFNLAQRQVSHGCVRLQRAADLAKALLGPSGWPPERVDQTIAGNDTSTVKLTQPTPVAILYWTAYVHDGKMFFRQDPYGWDDQLVGLLDAPATVKG